MSLTTPSTIRELRIKLYRKAKNKDRPWKVVAATKGGLVRESTVKPVGKPDAGNRPVRFDERGWKTGRRFGVSARVQPRLYSQIRGPATKPRNSAHRFALRVSWQAPEKRLQTVPAAKLPRVVYSAWSLSVNVNAVPQRTGP